MKTGQSETCKSAVFSLQHVKLTIFTLIITVVVTLIWSSDAPAQNGPAGNSAEAIFGLEKQEGFLPFYWDEDSGKVLLELSDFDTDVLYYISAATGGGSVELPLDRGILASKVIHFHRSGPKVLVVEQNLDYRAIGGSQERADNVDLSFPDSILAALPIVGSGDGTLIVDGSPLFLSDAAAIEPRLNSRNQGTFRYDASRSAFYPLRMKAFPENTEIETIATYSITNPGVTVNNVVPDVRTLSLRVHYSFLKAPEGYTPRLADPRIGVSSIDFSNYANAFDEGTEENWITRWRLEKKDPDAALSDPIKPIIFYFDPAIPEPVKAAMKQGTLWWNDAFEAAGFSNAVEVRDPTPDMDPMDIRFAWLQWIERDERGFSSGGTYRDPRTGEVLGSKTRMDSHRIRTIANYYESYMQASAGPGEMPQAQSDMVLLRQAVLTAHELGHVLGFGHNWASSINDRASVMEYPTPRVAVVDGKLDISESFAVGVGEYDKFMARYAYTVLEADEETVELDAIIADMRAAEILYVPSTDPRWAWYDDRSTPTEYLDETMAAREIMIDQYGTGMLEDGEPIGELRDIRFWMTYLHHRWAIEAGQGYIGGMYHNIVVKGEDLPATEIVPAELQRDILDRLMQAIDPKNLLLPESLLTLLTPNPAGELEDMSSGYAVDQISLARTLAAMVIEPLLTPERAARLVAFVDRQPDTVSLPELVELLLENTWQADSESDARLASLQRATQRVLLDSMMILGASDEATPEVRAYILDQLYQLQDDILVPRGRDLMAQAHARQAIRDIASYLENPSEYAPDAASEPWGSRPRSRYPLPPGPPL